MDYYGGDLIYGRPWAWTLDESECCSLCGMLPDCYFWTFIYGNPWNATLKNACYLKDNTPTLVSNPGTITGKALYKLAGDVGPQ